MLCPSKKTAWMASTVRETLSAVILRRRRPSSVIDSRIRLPGPGQYPAKARATRRGVLGWPAADYRVGYAPPLDGQAEEPRHRRPPGFQEPASAFRLRARAEL